MRAKTQSLSVASKDICILVVSCDAYKDLWPVFFHCFFKYWPDCPYPMYLGSNQSTYVDARVTPVLVGQDRDYSSNLLAMLQQIDYEWVILWIEDRPPAQFVDTDRITRIIDLARTRRAAYLKLISCYPLAYVRNNKEIGEIPKNSRYRASMTVALWRRQVLQTLLRPGESAWQIEKVGSARTDEFDDAFYALPIGERKSPPIQDVHLIIKGHLLRDSVKFLNKEGILSLLRDRPIETWRTFFYVKVYLAFFHIYYQIQRLRLVFDTRHQTCNEATANPNEQSDK